jgi:endo-1,3-1,4-beta-glycanase ExoK
MRFNAPGGLPAMLVLAGLTWAAPSSAVSSAELYQNQTYTYGRFEARVRFAAGDGVVSSFFLWKPGSEVAGTFWNELDFEKIGADCRLQTNSLYGAPLVDRGRIASVPGDLCTEYHTYTFEWTPSYIAFRVDGVEVRRDTGEDAAVYAVNAAAGMRIHFNVWPGDASFGGVFDAASLPLQQYIAWVEYSSFAGDAFTFEWREDFSRGTLPSGWSLGNWASPKNLSTHSAANVGFLGDVAVLSLTADDATGFTGVPPVDGNAGTGGSSSGGAGSGGSGAQSGAGSTSGGRADNSSRPRSDGGCSYGTAPSRSGRTSSALALGAGALLGVALRRGRSRLRASRPRTRRDRCA